MSEFISEIPNEIRTLSRYSICVVCYSKIYRQGFILFDKRLVTKSGKDRKFNMNTLNEIKEGPKISMEVMVRLANTLFSYRSIKKTHLYLHSRTNWNSFDRHMKLLVKNGYVKYDVIEKDEEYILTESGRELLELLLQFNEKIHKSS